MSDIRKYFTIMANDAGQEAYRASYVHEIERQLADVTKERDKYREALEFIAKQEDHAGNWAVEKQG